MSKEGSIDAPIRHPIDFEHPAFLNPEKLDTEMRRVFDVCHKRGAIIKTIVTKSGKEFVTPLSIASLTNPKLST